MNKIVALNGFINLDEDNEPCRMTGNPTHSQEYDLEGTDGWSVTVNAQNLDFPPESYHLARFCAEHIATWLGYEVREY